ncbi:MAG: helix-turn-helix transcriptional regulator [Burkholderiales bacterium]|nr:helix-turn-helix transcriptional regulator [Burkholderiales bacterium]
MKFSCDRMTDARISRRLNANGKCAPRGGVDTFWCESLTMQGKTNLPAGVPASASRMVEDIVGCKWSIAVLTLVRKGVNRPGAMEHAIEGLSAKVLNERLRKLMRYGILGRTSYPELPPRVEYALTPFGEKFVALLDGVERLQADIDSTSMR